jgi:hypothetical protein
MTWVLVQETDQHRPRNDLVRSSYSPVVWAFAGAWVGFTGVQRGGRSGQVGASRARGAGAFESGLAGSWLSKSRDMVLGTRAKSQK